MTIVEPERRASSHRVLAEIPVLVIDCQATSADPEKGRLLEIGWAIVRACEVARAVAVETTTSVPLWPSEEDISRRVSRVTGLTRDVVSALGQRSEEEIWTGLLEAAKTIGDSANGNACTTVIHFARFEKPHLDKLHQRFAPDTVFPFEILCTHEIARRLLPHLPRRSLRALAGRFGHSVPELRRSAHHVIATAIVWSNLVEQLEKECGVRTLEELRGYLAGRPVSTRAARTYPMEPALWHGLPDEPGVYRLLRPNGDVLYVGKAKSLGRRVRSYFQNGRHHAEHILEMLSQASKIEATVTETALEAALLESDEIKRLAPPYNVALRTRDRKLAFCPRDFTRFADAPQGPQWIGPLPFSESLRPLAFLRDWIETKWSSGAVPRPFLALGVPPEHAPDETGLRSGLEWFVEKHGPLIHDRPVPSALIRLGTLLWHEAILHKNEPGAHDDVEENERESRRSDPEAVLSSLEQTLVRSVRVIRRARWLCRLSESCLAWETSVRSSKLLLIFSRGCLVYRDVLPKEAQVPMPPGSATSLLERQRSFNLATYDRLQVLTTEIRRLTAEERSIELRLGATTALDRGKLVQTLRWL